MRGMGRVGGEKVGGRFNQNTINACMKFSSHKLKRGESLLQFGNCTYIFYVKITSLHFFLKPVSPETCKLK